MSSFQITNHNFCFFNEKTNYNDISPRRTPRFPLNKFDYGSKIKEKKNYILYAGGVGYERPYYEECKKSLPIRIIKNKNDIYKKRCINRNYRKCIEYEEVGDNALLNLDNYRYKETKNIKNEDPNLKILTIHKRLGSPRSPRQAQNKHKTIRIKKTTQYNWHREGYNNYNNSPNRRRLNINNYNINNDNSNEQIKILRENKSYDYLQSLKNRKQKFINTERNNDEELIQEKIEPEQENDYYYNNNDYESHKKEVSNNNNNFIRIISKKKEINPNNYFNNKNEIYSKNKSKIIKISKNIGPIHNQDNNEIYHYHKKRIRNNKYEKEPYYIGNYGDEKNNESMREYKTNEDYNKNRYIAKDRYQNECERYGNYCRNDEENECSDNITEIKKIKCPLHGNISIIMHKNPL